MQGTQTQPHCQRLARLIHTDIEDCLDVAEQLQQVGNIGISEDNMELFYKIRNRSSSSKKPRPGLATDNNRWAAAVGRLSVVDRERFDFAKTLKRDPSEVLADVLAATNEKKDEFMKRRWKLVIKGHTIILRDVLEKISVWVNKVKTVGDIAVSYDPTHAALPWAAIRLILQASVNDVEVSGYVLYSIEGITNAIAAATVFEHRYLTRNRPK